MMVHAESYILAQKAMEYLYVIFVAEVDSTSTDGADLGGTN
jgi:hypothetical protein